MMDLDWDSFSSLPLTKKSYRLWIDKSLDAFGLYHLKVFFLAGISLPRKLFFAEEIQLL